MAPLAGQGGDAAVHVPRENGQMQMDDLALSTSADEPIEIHERENGAVHGPQKKLSSKMFPDRQDIDANLSKEEEEAGGAPQGAAADQSSAHTIDNSKHAEEPEGGKYGVRAIIGGFGISFCTWGMSGSWSVLQDTYERNQLRGYSSSEIAWIGSAQTCMIYLASAFAGRLFDDGYMSWV